MNDNFMRIATTSNSFAIMDETIFKYIIIIIIIIIIIRIIKNTKNKGTTKKD